MGAPSRNGFHCYLGPLPALGTGNAAAPTELNLIQHSTALLDGKKSPWEDADHPLARLAAVEGLNPLRGLPFPYTRQQENLERRNNILDIKVRRLGNSSCLTSQLSSGLGTE